MSHVENLVWLDLETTGLDLQLDLVIEIGIVVTTPDLEEVASWSGIMMRLPDQEKAARRFLGEVYEMHKASGLLEEASRGQNMIATEEDALEFLYDVSGQSMSPLCGSSPHFDRAFLRENHKELHDWFHYRNFDASSVLRFTKMLRPDFEPVANPSKHRAIDDVLRSINLVRQCREALR
jgi:oligoribonuclease